MAHICISLLIVAVLMMSQGVSAKRGCFSFGHSCLGGHGKRSEGFRDSNSELMGPRALGQEETAPHPEYPHNGYALPSGDDIIPVRDGGIYDRDDNAAREVMMKYKLRNLVKHWMEGYRRSLNDNGDLTDNL